jgi:hypothetical protein
MRSGTCFDMRWASCRATGGSAGISMRRANSGPCAAVMIACISSPTVGWLDWIRQKAWPSRPGLWAITSIAAAT